jgi:hypothetical protein
MEISRHNYEQYFIDYLDGKLSEEQVGILMTFLEFNQDLKEELGGIEKMALAPDETTFAGKTGLLKSEYDLAEATILKDFDMYCISSMEHDITEQEEEIIQRIIRDDPDREETYMLYRSTRLLPDESILYPGKARLKKRFIIVPYRIILPAAAAVAAMLVILQLFNGSGSESGNLILTDQVPGNSQDELQTELPGAREISPPVTAPQDSGEKVSAEISMVMSEIIAGMQTSPVINSGLVADSANDREKIRMAKISSKSIHQVEGPVSNPVGTGPGHHAPQLSRLLVDHNKSTDPSADDHRLSLWILADAGVRGLNSVSEDEYHLDREKDKNGNIRRFTLDTPIFGISAPLRKTGKSE